MRIRIARNTNFVHLKEVLKEHKVLEHIAITEVLELFEVELNRTAVYCGVLECEHRVLKVRLNINVINHVVALDRCQCIGKLSPFPTHCLIHKIALSIILSSTQWESIVVEIDLVGEVSALTYLANEDIFSTKVPRTTRK